MAVIFLYIITVLLLFQALSDPEARKQLRKRSWIAGLGLLALIIHLYL